MQRVYERPLLLQLPCKLGWKRDRHERRHVTPSQYHLALAAPQLLAIPTEKFKRTP